MSPEELESRGFDNEWKLSASRSSGAGGQNVNKVNTKVELRFNVPESNLLTTDEKELITIKLASQLTNDGDLIIVSQSARTQIQNKQIAFEKFYKLLSKTLTIRKKRKPTAPSFASKTRRLEGKRIVSEKKELRKKLE